MYPFSKISGFIPHPPFLPDTIPCFVDEYYEAKVWGNVFVKQIIFENDDDDRKQRKDQPFLTWSKL